jgi:hypothetical protein
MPTVKLRLILAPLCALLAAAVVAGCGGGDDEPKPSIPQENAATLLSTLEEVEANINDGSCLVAADRISRLQDEIQELPADVNEDVSRALQNGADQLSILVEDPDQCDRPEETTTTEETTTDEDTTTEETTTDETTTEETTTEGTTTQEPIIPPDNGGGVGPPNGGGDGL